MVQSRRYATFRSYAALGLALLALIVVAACGGGSGDDIEPTATEPQAATATPGESPRSDTEMGEAPIFWQPQDEEFQSLRAGEPYKVLFRITGDYDAETLRIVAEQKVGRSGAEEFEAFLSEPTGEEAPGSYYPVSLDLPKPGRWIVTVLAGDDMVSFTVQVAGPAN
jgi:hypothetical protein